MQQRLQKCISEAGVASRRTAEAMISAGRVTVNGRTAQLGAQADPETDVICIDGRPLPPRAPKRYIMLNKPRGYVTTMHDERGRKTVADLVAFGRGAAVSGRAAGSRFRGPAHSDE